MLIVGACKEHRHLDVLEFGTEYELHTELLSLNALMITYPFDMFVTDEHIYILGIYNNKWVHCFDRLSGKYIDSFVSVGRGPGEVISCTKMTYDTKLRKLYLYDSSTEKLLSYSISENQTKIDFEDEILFQELEEPVVLYQIWPLSDHTLLVNSQSGSMEEGLTRFQILTNTGEQICTCSDMPDLTIEDRYTYLQSTMTLSPDRTHFASVTLMGEILEIYELSDMSITRSVEKIYSYPNISFRDGVVWETDDTIWGFPFVCSDNRYIYAAMTNDKRPNNFNKIAVFDWSGSGVLKLTTDYNILRLAPYEGKIYSIVANSVNELFIAKYDFDRLINECNHERL